MNYNQILQWSKTSDYWYMLRNLSEKKKNMEITYVRNGFTSKVPYVNVLWYYISKEFKEKIGEEIKVYKHLDLFTSKELTEEDRLDLPSIYIHTSIHSCSFSWNLSFTVRLQTETSYNIEPPKCMELTEENIVKYIFAYAQNKSLYPAGCFRDLQYYYSLNKETIKKHYKTLLKNKNLLAYEDEDIIQWIKRKYKIDCSGFDIYQAIDIVTKYGKQKELKKAMRFDYDFLNGFDGDVNEAETLFWEEIESYPKNTLLVD